MFSRPFVLAVIAIAIICPVGAAQLKLSQSLDDSTITPANSVSCNAGAPDFNHADNSYIRFYNITASGEFAAAIDISAIRFGVESADSAGGAGQPVEIRLYETPAGAKTFGSFTLLHTESYNQVDVAQGSNTIVTRPINPPLGVVNDVSKDIVVEVFTPSGQAAGHSFFIGSNGAGETASSYLAASSCGINEPATTSSIGQPSMNIVLDICYSRPPSTYPGTGEDLEVVYSLNLAPFVTAGFGTDSVSMFTNDCLEFVFTSPGGTFAGGGAYLAVGSLIPTGTVIPEVGAGTHIYVALGSAFIADGFRDFLGNPVQLPSNGSSTKFTYPGGLFGTSCELQGFVITASAANSNYAATNGLTIDFQL